MWPLERTIVCNNVASTPANQNPAPRQPQLESASAKRLPLGASAISGGPRSVTSSSVKVVTARATESARAALRTNPLVMGESLWPPPGLFGRHDSRRANADDSLLLSE